MSDQPSVFAGRFYPLDPDALRSDIERHLSAVRQSLPEDLPGARVVIAPHAGYRYCMGLMARAFARMPSDLSRLLVISPSHRHRFDGLAIPAAERYATPLGPVPLDQKICSALSKDGVHILPDAFANEHGVEVLLPFVRHIWPSAQIVPLVCGRGGHRALPELIDTLMAEPKTGLILSSDLSHFHDAEAAKRLDDEASRRIETAELRGFGGEHACGWQGIGGWLLSDLGQRYMPVRLGRHHSGDITGESERVVGYGAWAFYDGAAAGLGKAERAELLRVARVSLRGQLRKGKAPMIKTPTFASPLQTFGASFVTLTHQGRLRGCIGSLRAQRPLVEDVAANGIKSGIHDKRFRPLQSAQELEALEVKIAVLSRAAPLRFTDRDDALAKITPGESGLIIEDQGKRGTFLPMVWDSLETPDAFLSGLVVKAGLPRGHWSDSVKLWHFRADSFAENAG